MEHYTNIWVSLTISDGDKWFGFFVFFVFFFCIWNFHAFVYWSNQIKHLVSLITLLYILTMWASLFRTFPTLISMNRYLLLFSFHQFQGEKMSRITESMAISSATYWRKDRTWHILWIYLRCLCMQESG